MKRIRKVQIKTIPDEYPDTSWMGSYDNVAKSEYAIETHRGWRPTTYRYFNAPVENYAGEKPEDIRKYAQQDFERMESLNDGQWQFIGIRADVEIQTSEDGKTWLCNKITSGGLWGIESDAGKDYLNEIAQEQLNELKTALLELGFSQEEIDTALVLPE